MREASAPPVSEPADEDAAARAGEAPRPDPGAPASAGDAPAAAAAHDDIADGLYDVLARDPGDEAALLELSRRHAARGESQAGLFFLRVATLAHPTKAAPHRRLAQALADLDLPDEAEGALRAAIALEPQDPETHLALGRLRRARGDAAGALAFLLAAQALRPGDATIASEAAACLVALGRPDAAPASDPVDPQDAGDPDALRDLAMAYRRRGEHEAALGLFLRLARSRVEEGLTEAALEWRVLGRPEAARKALRQALAIDSTYDLALLRLAELEIDVGDSEVALAACDAAITAHPAMPRPWGLKANLLVRLGRLDEAKALLAALSAAEAPPQTAGAGLSVARTLRDVEAAGRLIDRTGEAAKTSFDLWWERTTSLVELGRLAEAQEAIAHAPDGGVFGASRVRLIAGRCADAAWRTEAAIAAYGEAVRAYGAMPEAHDSLARLWFLCGDADASLRSLRARLELEAGGGRPGSPSQTFCGQLLNELRLDPEVQAKLAEISALPAEPRVDALMQVVREAPGSTAAALMLMLALRQSGALARRPGPASSGPSPIPRRIVQIFGARDPEGGEPAATDLWAAQLPNFDCLAFDDAGAQAFLEREAAPEVLDAYLRAPTPDHASHVFGYAYLAKAGGVFAMAEPGCVAWLGPLLGKDTRFLAFQESWANLGTSLLACAPGEPVVTRALASAVEAIRRGDNEMPWLAAGPGLLTRAFAQDLAERAEAWGEALVGRTILDRAAFDGLVTPQDLSPRRSARDHLQAGEAFAAQGRLALAVQEFDQALRLDRRLAQARARRAEVRLALVGTEGIEPSRPKANGF